MNITIHREDGGAFFVLHGDKFADGLTFDEMLGMVAVLAMPANHPAPRWLRTASDWREDTRRSMARMAGMSDEPLVTGDLPTATELVDVVTDFDPKEFEGTQEFDDLVVVGRQRGLADPEKWAAGVLTRRRDREGANARVVGDWTATSDSRVTEFPIPADGEPGAPVDVSPIHRADVQLKVGDVVRVGSVMSNYVRSGDVGEVTIVSENGATFEAKWSHPLKFSDDNRWWATTIDIVTLNSRPIIDSEEG